MNNTLTFGDGTIVLRCRCSDRKRSVVNLGKLLPAVYVTQVVEFSLKEKTPNFVLIELYKIDFIKFKKPTPPDG